MHHPESPGFQNDDRLHNNVNYFVGKQIVVTEKLDDENTTFYHDYIHARSLDSGMHPSRTWVKGLYGRIQYQIPEDGRICGENVFAKHSIYYKNLETYFYVFSVWDENDNCLSWDETKEFCKDLTLQTVPIIDRLTLNNWKDVMESYKMYYEKKKDDVEGWVARVANSFNFNSFALNVCKYVRKGHVQTDQNWMYQPVVQNGLIKL